MDIDHSALVFFDSPTAWRTWLARYHASATVCWVGFHRKDTGVKSITYPEALEEALCYGWIDGIRKVVREGQYTVRFTPRKPTSYWSAVNLRLVARLTKAGRMTDTGLRVFRTRQKEKSGTYSYERAHATFSRAEERAFRANRAAWTFFQAQPPGYRKLATFWITSARRPETRARRLAVLVEASAAARRYGAHEERRTRQRR